MSKKAHDVAATFTALLQSHGIQAKIVLKQ
jgi:hypothetical protein